MIDNRPSWKAATAPAGGAAPRAAAGGQRGMKNQPVDTLDFAALAQTTAEDLVTAALDWSLAGWTQRVTSSYTMLQR